VFHSVLLILVDSGSCPVLPKHFTFSASCILSLIAENRIIEKE
jgi:hypothetical protein